MCLTSCHCSVCRKFPEIPEVFKQGLHQFQENHRKPPKIGMSWNLGTWSTKLCQEWPVFLVPTRGGHLAEDDIFQAPEQSTLLCEDLTCEDLLPRKTGCDFFPGPTKQLFFPWQILRKTVHWVQPSPTTLACPRRKGLTFRSQIVPVASKIKVPSLENGLRNKKFQVADLSSQWCSDGESQLHP